MKSIGGITSNSGLNISGGDILSSGKITVSSTATSSFSGGPDCQLSGFRHRLKVAELVSCDTINTDASGVLTCGTDADTNTSGFIDTGTIVRLQTNSDNVELADLYVIGSDINIGNGLQATSTLSGQYGNLGLGTTSPYGLFAIEATTLAGSNTPIFVVGRYRFFFSVGSFRK